MILKRLFDIVFSLVVLVTAGWLIVLIYIAACLDTKSNGFFLQERVGRHAKLFKIIKFKTVIDATGEVTPFGQWLRDTKLNELPQVFNILMGDMSVVGPRPDVRGYYDRLQGEDRKLLFLRPGLTGPASIKYSNEEQLLTLQDYPGRYNDEVIFPDKIRINHNYFKKRSLLIDMQLVFCTVFKTKKCAKMLSKFL